MIANSTPLIYLGKIGKLHLLKDLFGTIIISEEVKKEVVDQGKALHEPDAPIVERAINEGWIIVQPTKILDTVKDVGIDKGEMEAISLAVTAKDDILLDQTHARVAAELVGLEPHGTLFVLLKALAAQRIGYDEYISLLENLITAGFRMSDEIYLKAISAGKKYEQKRE
ncbi:hypothetical protein HYU19_01205 [Candidatus Woesearchaeota archaeon]|nr:hypothetical protein [Candidatus Woesearchaeota archaeon]